MLFRSDGPQKQELLLRKDVYPYDYVDGPEKLEETQLPPKQEFYSKLYEEGISDEDYQHAKMSGGPSTAKPLETTMMST